VTRRLKVQLAVLAVVTGIAVCIAVWRGFDPTGYYMRGLLEGEKWTPPYGYLAGTAGWMIGEGALIWFVIGGPRWMPRWLRCLLAAAAAGYILFALLLTLMHAPPSHAIHLFWDFGVFLMLLGLLAESLARTYPRPPDAGSSA